MKKLLVVLLLLGALLGLLSCNSSKPSQTTPSTTTPPTTPSITTPPQTTTTPAPTTAPERKINVGKMGYVISYNGQTTADNRLKSLLSASLSAKGISLSSIPEGFAANAYEILLTNISLDQNAVEMKNRLFANSSEHIGAYAIKVLPGDKILISASCEEAEDAAVDALCSFWKSGEGLLVPSTLEQVVFFDIAAYKKSGTLEIFREEDLAGTTELVSIRFFDDVVIDVTPGVSQYQQSFSALQPLPTLDDIAVTPYYSDMEYSVSLVDRLLKISVTSRDEKSTKEYQVEIKVADQYTVPAEIVNKNGAQGVLTLISDDGDQRTSDFFYTVVAPNYSSFKITIAMPTKNIASLSKTLDGSAWLKDENGKYVLTVLDNSYNSVIPGSAFASAGDYPTRVDFWKKIVSCDAIELASHSHTHAAWGLTDEQNGSYPAGNVIKELHASAQILRDLIGQDTPFILRPGGHTDLTSEYFFDLVESDDTFIGMRSSNGAAPFLTASGTKLNTVEMFKNPDNRLKIATILVKSFEAAFNGDGSGFATPMGSSAEECIAAGVGAWTNYVDLAIENGGWASIGFHSVAPDTAGAQNGYTVFDSQVLALMDYVQPLVESGELWLASFQEAAKYYFEWSSAEFSATAYDDDKIEITLTDNEEDARFDEKLTMKVSVPYSWTAAELESYGTTEALTIQVADDGTHFVYVNILPGSEISTIRPVSN